MKAANPADRFRVRQIAISGRAVEECKRRVADGWKLLRSVILAASGAIPVKGGVWRPANVGLVRRVRVRQRLLNPLTGIYHARAFYA